MTDYFKTGTMNSGRFGKSWHGKEAAFEPITDDDNVTDAMAKAKMLDIHVGTYKMNINVNGTLIETKDERLVMTGCSWNDNGLQDLGRSVKTYLPIQNRDYAEMLNPLSNHYPVMGVLMVGNVGQTMIVQMEMPPFEIGGLESEKHEATFFVAEDRLGGTNYFGSVNTRIVCQNTFNMAIGEKGTKSMPNSKDSAAFMQFRVRIEEQAVQSRQNYIDGLNYLFTKKVQNDDIDNLLNSLFVPPKLPAKVQLWQDNQDVLNGDEVSTQVDKSARRALGLYQNEIDRQEKQKRELVENFFKFNDEFSYAANTGYALFQATTEFYNHSEQWQSEQDAHMYNVHFGDKAKQMSTAWQILTK